MSEPSSDHAVTRAPRIRRLPTELANQIAAGEVVERPASIVKELVENALDAGATRVVVTVELGGKRLVRVEDDGEGMTPDEAVLALERHATSKIRRLEDLAAITTLGFRGEALPSIASVSHLLLRTRARGASHGTEIRVSGGVVASTREVGAPEGTTLEVTDLFYNVPARRKFLKSDGAETTQVSRLVTQLALGHPGVGFTLTSGSRRLLQCPPAASLADRLFQLYKDRSDLVEVRKAAAGLQVTGFVAALAGPAAKRYRAQGEAGENPWNSVTPMAVTAATDSSRRARSVPPWTMPKRRGVLPSPPSRVRASWQRRAHRWVRFMASRRDLASAP